MTPEVLLCKPYTKELDIYSLGVIIFKISTEKSLFENESYNIDLQLEIRNAFLAADKIILTLSIISKRHPNAIYIS